MHVCLLSVAAAVLILSCCMCAPLGPQEAMNLTRKDVFNFWSEKKGASYDARVLFVKTTVLNKFQKHLQDSDVQDKFIQEVKRCCSELKQMWCKQKLCTADFIDKNSEWLDKALRLPAKRSRSSTASTGRPSKDFESVCDRTKRCKVKCLQSAGAANVLSYAAQMNHRKEGNEDAAKLIHEMHQSPSRASRIRTSWESQKKTKPCVSYSEDEALSLFVEGDFSKSQYLLLREGARNHNSPNLYPSYHKLSEAKERCIPDTQFITITESIASVALQALLDHTAKRLVVLQEPVFESLDDQEITVELISKWGFDGSSGQSNYKMKFEDSDSNDSSMFISSVVPLEIRAKNSSNSLIWYNTKPSSTRLCRPIRILFKKETTELSLSEKEIIDNQIEELTPSTFTLASSKRVKVIHRLVCTMIDGKVVSALTGISTQSCTVCKATPKQFNDIEAVCKRAVNKEVYKFGLSTLHAHIRFLEFCLHVAYRLEVKKWSIRDSQSKEIVSARKKQIQEDLFSELGIRVDLPKQGSGTTNDGNTARRFFEYPSKTAKVTNLDLDLLNRFSVILQVLACGFAVNVEAFRNYASETATLYVSLYPWFYMPSSVHKILIHGADIIDSLPMPIGRLSEEAQESRNKDVKRFREYRARKCSRIATNQDLIRRLLVTSDPIISSMRKPPNRRTKPINETVLRLLTIEALDTCSDHSDTTDIDESVFL